MPSIEEILQGTRDRGRTTLTEPEGFALLREAGLETPRSILVRDADEVDAATLDAIESPRLVVKVASPEVAHRAAGGGVAIVPNELDAVREAVSAIVARYAGRELDGCTLDSFVEHDAGAGGELLLGARFTEDFGPVVTLAPGGTRAEPIAQALRPGHDVAFAVPAFDAPAQLESAIAETLFGRLATERFGGGEPRVSMELLVQALRGFLDLARRRIPADIREIEVNPLVFHRGRPVALDVLCRVADGTAPDVAPPRPMERLANLLRPASIAVMGVSKRGGPGATIVDNLLRDGFDPQRSYVIKPGIDDWKGLPCVPDLASLPEAVDLLVVSVDASQVPQLVEQAATEQRARSLIVIPGGLGEREGTEPLAAQMRDSLDRSRERPDGGPVVNGGNSLGLRSRPGGYDTLFTPAHKVPLGGGTPVPLAMISQSGAHMLTLASRLPALDPAYMISVGNQTDLTVGDYLHGLLDDPEIEIAACYVEGFRPLDGLRWLEAAAAMVASGRPVLLYRAGHTAAGAEATASHTASIAGDYAVTRGLALAAGVEVADTLQDFADLVKLTTMLRHKRVDGMNLAALTNAGFEAVALADGWGTFHYPAPGAGATARLEALFGRFRLERVVSVRNPLDLTPIVDDAGYEEAARALLDDPAVNLAILGCVPQTGALNTLAPAARHDEDLDRAEAVAARLVAAAAESDKASIAVVDSGALYDPLAARLEQGGLPTFRSMDRAVRLLGRYAGRRLRVGR